MSDSSLMLSVSGARGIVGQGMTPTVAARFGGALAGWARQRNDALTPHVVVGRDGRQSGDMLERAAISGLLGAGCHVTRLGVATTPGIAIMTAALGADAGLAVTASHNPSQWNGLKPLLPGTSPPADDSARLIERFNDSHDEPWVDVDSVKRCDQRDDVDRLHARRVAAGVDVEAIRRANLTVAVDSVHGSGGRETVALLHALGVRYFHFHPEPTGRFPRDPEPTAANLAPFCQQLAPYKPDVVFAQDPDADRLALIDEQCRYIGEEYTLALCAQHRLQRGETAVANLSTSRMIDDVAERAGARVVRTPVGEANVAAAMRAERAALGGEGNGGIILPEVSHVRDSLVGIALVLEMLAHKQQPLSAVARELPAYAIVKDKAPAEARITGALRETLGGHYADQSIDDQDGVRVDWSDRWVHVRPSNTEPIVRLIAEARDHDQAEALLKDVKQTLGIDGQ